MDEVNLATCLSSTIANKHAVPLNACINRPIGSPSELENQIMGCGLDLDLARLQVKNINDKMKSVVAMISTSRLRNNVSPEKSSWREAAWTEQ